MAFSHTFSRHADILTSLVTAETTHVPGPRCHPTLPAFFTDIHGVFFEPAEEEFLREREEWVYVESIDFWLVLKEY